MSSDETIGVPVSSESGLLDVASIKYDPTTDWRSSRGRLPIIGIGGPFGSGKDECAKAVASMFERPAVVRFADGVRDGLLRMNPIVHANSAGMKFSLANVVDAIGWDNAKEIYPEVRRLMQAYGDDAGRQVHGQDCWVKRLKAKVNELEFLSDDKRPQCYIVPDVRYPDEIDFINTHGLGCMFVDRPGIDASEAARQHASESHFQYIRGRSQRIVVNDGTLGQLHDRASRAASRLMMNLFVDDDAEGYPSFASKDRELDKLRFIAGGSVSKILATDGRIAACMIADQDDCQWCSAYGAKRHRDGMVQFVRDHFPDNEPSDESKYEHAGCTSGLVSRLHSFRMIQPPWSEHCDHDDVAVRMSGTSVVLAKRYHDILLRLPGCRFFSDKSVGEGDFLRFRFGTESSGHLRGRGMACGLDTSK